MTTRVQNNMKYLLFLINICSSLVINAQSGKDLQDKPSVKQNTNDKSISGSAYLNLEANKSNPDAWIRYYLNTERNESVSKELRQKILTSTFESSQQYIAGTWQYNLMMFLQSGKKDGAALHRALDVGDKAIVYPYAVQHAIITGNTSDLNKYTAVLNDIRPLSPVVYQYHYNTLMSAGRNATIYAKGLLDLVPLAIVQQQYKIRPDIKLKYYESTIQQEENAYICLSSGKEILEQYPQAAYTGLLIKVKSANTIKELEKNFGSFDLTAIKEGAVLTYEETEMHKNYLPSFILLHRYYKKKKISKADDLFNLIISIAEKAGIKDTVNKLLVQ